MPHCLVAGVESRAWRLSLDLLVEVGTTSHRSGSVGERGSEYCQWAVRSLSHVTVAKTTLSPRPSSASDGHESIRDQIEGGVVSSSECRISI
jgi:hypothetical protein